MSSRIINGDSTKELKKFKDNSIDAVICDPPYGIEFLAKEWDSNTGAVEIWQECLRVLKPGGHLLAFSAARTYHILATNIQASGFEIRDQIMWLYASGFPKAQDIGRAIERRKGNTRSVELHSNGTSPYCPICKKYTITRCDKCPPEPVNEWSGWKTALKPAHEPICMARKPMKGSTIDNVQKHGVGALNIDATRIGERFPSNVLGEVEGYQKFFYCPKVSRKERHRGFEQNNIPTGDNFGDALKGDAEMWGKYNKQDPISHIPTDNPTNNGNYMGTTTHPTDPKLTKSVGNNHPTVKPVTLMKYLIKLVAPKGAHIVDPFCGSGSTGMAAKELGYKFTGIEMDKSYCEIAKKRISVCKADQFEKLFN